MNWVGGVAPTNNSGNLLVLTGTVQTTNTLDLSLPANTLTFDAAAGAFVVGTASNETLTLSGGITNLTNERPYAAEAAYPVSARGRSFFLGARARF